MPRLSTLLAGAAGLALGAGAALAQDARPVTWWYEMASPANHDNLQTIVVSPFDESQDQHELSTDFRGNELDTQPRVALLSGSGPDIVYTPGPSYVASMAQAGQLLPLDDHAAQYGWTDRILPVFLDLGTYDGQLYALPKTYETLGLLYNKTLIEEHGWTPTTIAGLEMLADAMLAKGIVPFGAGNADRRPTNEHSVSIVLSIAGPDNVAQALRGEIPWISEAFVRAIDTLGRDHGRGPDHRPARRRPPRRPPAPLHRRHGARLGERLTMNVRLEAAPAAPLPADYLERVYAGILGKLIGVYLGRPFEQWTHDRIMAELGPIEGFVYERLRQPLVVTDDDVAGTFTFVRALDDYGRTPRTSGARGPTTSSRTAPSCGGAATATPPSTRPGSTSRRASPRPPRAPTAPRSPSRSARRPSSTAGRWWPRTGPNSRPASRARPAASAMTARASARPRLWAAMEAEAFRSRDVDHLLDTGPSAIPADCLIARLVADVRAWARSDNRWEDTRQKIEDRYGYAKFPGNCHVVPNHALMIMAILCAPHDFGHAQMIISTSGWDMDCNAGNVGCLQGIMLGLDGIDQRPGLRGSVADRMLISSADGGFSINDAVRMAHHLADLGRRLAGEAPLPAPKDGAQAGLRPGVPGAGRSRGLQPRGRWDSRAHPVLPRPGCGWRGRHHAHLLPARDAGHADLRPPGHAPRLSRPTLRAPQGRRGQRRPGDRLPAPARPRRGARLARRGRPRGHPGPWRGPRPRLAPSRPGRPAHRRGGPRSLRLCGPGRRAPRPPGLGRRARPRAAPARGRARGPPPGRRPGLLALGLGQRRPPLIQALPPGLPHQPGPGRGDHPARHPRVGGLPGGERGDPPPRHLRRPRGARPRAAAPLRRARAARGRPPDRAGARRGRRGAGRGPARRGARAPHPHGRHRARRSHHRHGWWCHGGSQRCDPY